MLNTENTNNTAQQGLTVRRLLVDLSKGFDKHWSGDAFTSNYFNALSMSFPVGEQFFIDAVKAGMAELPDTAENAPLKQLSRDFIGQEATHRHLHGLYNAQLQKQGYINHWGPRTERRLVKARETYFSKSNSGHLHELAVTAAYEHFTSLFGDQTLQSIGKQGDWLANAQEPLQTLWRWHAAEESEHKAVAFDLYIRLGGNHRWRMRWYRYVVIQFGLDVARQTLSNLWRDGSLFKLSTWISGANFIFGRHGFMRRNWHAIWVYTRPDFHPNQVGHANLSSQWLQQHAHQWVAVGK
jgi:hypothetical protein